MLSSQLQDLIQSIERTEHWGYERALQLSTGFIQEAPYDLIMDNAEDVAHGVNRVQVVFNRRFFDLFNSLIIKHHIDGSIMLVFNGTVSHSGQIMRFYDELVMLLGQGFNDDERNKSFKNRDKVESLSKGVFTDEEDLVGSAWIRPQYGFSLSYRIKPLRQLVFSITWSPKKQLDSRPRKNDSH